MSINSPGHTLIYVSRADTRIDRANIALLKRIVVKSTTPVFLEIYYDQPLQLGSWSEPAERVRYIRLRNDEKIAIAERIARAASDSVVVLTGNLLLAASDVWQLMGHATRNPIAVLVTRRIIKESGESHLKFLWRDARLRLQNYLYPAGKLSPDTFAIQTALFSDAHGITRASFRERIAFADFLQDLTRTRPLTVSGRSYAAYSGEKQRLLKTAFETGQALSDWHRNKKFPWWFSSRHFIFHVAQLSAYLALLTAFVSISAGAILLAFSALVTPQFFFSGFRLSRPYLWPLKAMASVFTYLFG